MGKSSQLLGQVFEKTIESALLETESVVLLKIDPVKQRGKSVKSKWLDYVGWHGGRVFTFDAKWIGNESRFKRSVLSKIQQGYLDRANASGALSFVLVGYIDGGRMAQACIPWSAMPARGSVELAPYRVEDWTAWVRGSL